MGCSSEGAKFLAAPNAFPVLTHLEIINTRLGNEETRVFAESVFATVTTLNLTNTRFVGADVTPFLTARVFPALVNLDLGNDFRLYSGIAQQLLSMDAGTFPHLAELNIACNELNDEEIGRIASVCPALTALYLNNTGINDEGLRRLAIPGAFPYLVSIGLSYNEDLSEIGISYLLREEAFPVLGKLDSRCTRFSYDHFYPFAPMVTNNRAELLNLLAPWEHIRPW